MQMHPLEMRGSLSLRTVSLVSFENLLIINFIECFFSNFPLIEKLRIWVSGSMNFVLFWNVSLSTLNYTCFLLGGFLLKAICSKGSWDHRNSGWFGARAGTVKLAAGWIA
jgi:hypothetical protein